MNKQVLGKVFQPLITFLKTLVGLYLFKKKILYCCFVDYSKAFDTVNRAALWSKLLAKGIGG